MYINPKNTVESKPLNKLSRHELSLVIDEERGRARTVEEQIAFVAPLPPVTKKAAERFMVRDNGNILVLAETEFTPAQWEEIGERAKAKAMKSLETKK